MMIRPDESAQPGREPLATMERARMLHAALDYACRGVPVFPCHQPLISDRRGSALVCSCGDRDCSRPAKHPLTRHGFKNATTRTEIIAGWWRRWPQANIAIPTGVVFDVLDLDGPQGVAAIRALVNEHRLEFSGPVVRTGSGGWHYLLAPTGQSSRVRLLEGVDWRGAGGYVIAPPSRHITGRCYQWARPLDLDALPQTPAPLRDLLMRRGPERTVTPACPPMVAGEVYGRAALDGELNRLRNAAPHTRNITLNRTAFRCFQLAAAGLLDPDQVTAEFTSAARQIGLGDQEIGRTLRSACTGGQTHPRTPHRTMPGRDRRGLER
jgi:Bifunctional DNA primase/polymerase, N-terminal